MMMRPYELQKDATSNADFFAVKEKINNLAENSKILIDELEEVSKIHPFISVAVVTFKAAISLELHRRETDDRVLALNATMCEMLSALVPLKNIDPTEQRDGLTIAERLHNQINGVARSVKDCAQLCDSYQKRHPAVRFLRSLKWQTKFIEFADVFVGHRNAIQLELQLYLTNTVLTLDQNVSAMMKMVFERMQPARDREIAALLQSKKGQADAPSDQLLEDIIRRTQQIQVGEDGSTDSVEPVQQTEIPINVDGDLEELRKDIDTILQENSDLFEKRDQLIRLILAGVGKSVVNNELPSTLTHSGNTPNKPKSPSRPSPLLVGAEIHRIQALLKDEARHRKLLSTTEDEAQKWLDLLQTLSEYPEIPANSRSSIFKLMIRLSKRSGLCPQCLNVENVKKLGEHPIDWGGFSNIWKGKIGKQVVCLKVVKVYQTSDVQPLIQGYMREAIVWRQLKHPNVLPFMGMYYFGDDREQLCLVSPWMERGNLVRYLKENPRDHTKRQSLAKDVARGLSHLHSMKIIHGDMKGINVLVTPDERACITDFGFARIADSQGLRFSSSISGSSGGTMRWLAPELLAPSTMATDESDIYAYGCVCYEIFTGRVPFHERNDVAVVLALASGNECPSRPSTPEVPDPIWEMMLSCWNRDPKLRPTTTGVLALLKENPEAEEQPTQNWTDLIDLDSIRANVKYPAIDSDTVARMWKNLDNSTEEQ